MNNKVSIFCLKYWRSILKRVLPPSIRGSVLFFVFILALSLVLTVCTNKTANQGNSTASPSSIHKTKSGDAKKGSEQQDKNIPAKFSQTLIGPDEIKQAMGDPPLNGYDLYAIKVGEKEKAKKNLFIRGASADEEIPLVFAFFALIGGGRRILIDSGFVDEEKIKSWKIINYSNPASQLLKIGIKADQITDIIITHRHWDHIGGISLFPRATCWMAEGEYNDAQLKTESSSPALFTALKQIKAENRLKFTEPFQHLFPGVAVVRQGAHTQHFQYVVLKNIDGIWILPSDEIPLDENLKNNIISGQTGNTAESEKALQTILFLAHDKEGSIEHVIPSHEPSVFKRFPEKAPGIVQISHGAETK